MFGGPFLPCSHVLSVLSVGMVTLLDPDLYGELSPELDIRLHSPMTSGVFLGLQNG